MGRSRRLRATAALVPTWALLGLGVIVPLLTLAWAARSGVPGAIDSTVPLGDRLARTGWVTLVQAGASTVATLAVGLPLAAALTRYQFPGRGVLRAVVAMPFVLPSVVVGAGVLALLGPGGPLGGAALQPGTTASLGLVVVAHVSYELIVVVAIVGARLEALPQAQLETARTLGAGSWRRNVAVVAPQVLPAVAGAAMLIFLLTAGSLGVVLIVGGPRWATLDAEVWYLGTQLLDLRGAASLALVQAAVVVAVGAAYLAAGRRPGTRGSGSAESGAPLGRGGAGSGRRPRGAEWGWVVMAVGLVAAFSAAPFVALGARLGGVSPTSFVSLWTDGTRGVPPLGAAAARSLGAALVVAAVCVVAAIGVGLAVRLGHGRLTQGVLALPVGVSAAAIGLGVVVMALVGPIDLRGSAAAVVLVQAAAALPFAVGVIMPVIAALPRSLEEVAASLGAGQAQRWRRVVLPVTATAIAGGAALAAAVALGEFGASTFVVRGDAPTLPTLVGRLLSRQSPESVALGTLVAAVLGLMCGLLVVLAQALAQRSRYRQ